MQAQALALSFCSAPSRRLLFLLGPSARRPTAAPSCSLRIYLPCPCPASPVPSCCCLRCSCYHLSFAGYLCCCFVNGCCGGSELRLCGYRLVVGQPRRRRRLLELGLEPGHAAAHDSGLGAIAVGCVRPKTIVRSARSVVAGVRRDVSGSC